MLLQKLNKGKDCNFKMFVLVLVCSITFIGQFDCYADETSGQIIKELVEEVDQEMTELENEIATLNTETINLEDKLSRLGEDFEKSDNFMEKEKLRAEVINTSVLLNIGDTKEIATYKQTIGEIMPKLGALRAEIKNINNMGFEDREEFFKFRGRLGNMMQNSVRIIRSLRRTTDDQKTINELTPIEDTILGIYESYKDNELEGTNYDSVVEDNIKNLEMTFAQLNNVERLLDKERMRLKVDNLNQISKLALIRLFKGRLNMTSIQEFANEKVIGIRHRSEIYSKTGTGSFDDNPGSSSGVHSKIRDEKLDRIAANHNFFSN